MVNKNIKAILKNPLLAFTSLGYRGFFNWMNDEDYLKIAYKIKMGKNLNIQNPVSFNEKIQTIKLKYRDSAYSKWSDKLEAKGLAEALLGKQYIIPTLGVWKNFDDIDFSSLPNSFVLKCTHDSGGIVICKNKETLDIKKAKKKINNSLKHNYYWAHREWAYKNIDPRIIVEEFIQDRKKHSLIDYKYFCFNSEPEFLYISEGLEDHNSARISFCDLEGKELPFCRSDYKRISKIELPSNMDEMIDVARKIAKAVDVPFLRVDLYSVDNHIYFSEATFYPCAGFMPIEPMIWDDKLGEKIKLTGLEGLNHR